MKPAHEVAALPYGTQQRVGLYWATVLADMDFETYSEAGYAWDAEANKWASPPGAPKGKKGLGVVGVTVYTEHPTFEVLSLKYDLKDGRGVRTWRPGLALPQDLFDHVANGRLIEAHNAGFEMAVWRRCIDLYGWPPVPYDNFRCSMAKARASALPGALDRAAEVLGTLRKDPAGDALLRRFAMPQNPTKKRPTTRIRPQDDPEGFERLLGYNETDIVAEAHLSFYTPDLTPIELEHWQVDQAINRRGVHIDEGVLRGAAAIVQQVNDSYGRQALELTGGISPTQIQKIREWCAARGCPLPSLDEDAVADALKRPDLAPEVRRVLELRALVGSSSVKKVFAMLNQRSASGRLTHLFNFHAARTGRPTGDGPQPTNLPKAGPRVHQCICGRWYGVGIDRCPWCLRPDLFRVNRDGELNYQQPVEWNPDAMLDALSIISLGSKDLLEHFFGDALLTIAGSLRGMFNAADGHVLMSSDYTAIEAVVLACLAGEAWRIDLFRNRGKIYEKSGALIGNVSYEAVLEYAKLHGQHHPLRQVGKTAELGLGYRGWITAWRNFDPDPNTTDEFIKDTILKWRAASPAIVEFWGGQSRKVGYNRYETDFYGVEGTFIKARLHPETWFEFRGLYFFCRDDTVYLRLPSGRLITYRNVTLRRSERMGNTYDISYWGWNTNPNNGPQFRWIEIRTHGGKLTENIVQAVSNDVLRYALANLERAGYPVVLHVYDEIVSEVPEGGSHTLDEFERLMTTLPDWAVLPDGTPWPIRADGGWVGKNYRKG